MPKREKPNKDFKRFSFWIPRDVYKFMQDYCGRDWKGLPEERPNVSDLVRTAVREFMDRELKKREK